MNRNKFADDNQNIKDQRRLFVELGQVWTPKDTKGDYDGVYIESYEALGTGRFNTCRLFSVDRLMEQVALKMRANRFTGIEVDQQMRPLEDPSLRRLTELQNIKQSYAFVRENKTTPMSREEVVLGFSESDYERKNISW